MGLPDVTDFKNHDGLGLSGHVTNHVVHVGNIELMTSQNVEVGDEEREILGEWGTEGCTVIMVAVDNKVCDNHFLYRI